MDPLIRHSIRTGLVTPSQLAEAINIDETVFAGVLLGDADLDKISTSSALEFCTKLYHDKRHELIGPPAVSDNYGIRHADGRGCVHIPKVFREKIHTENFKLKEVIDAYGNPILIISGAHLPDPELNIPEPTAPQMPPPEEL